jgi:prepilin-type N-terminal cleavage/methylation domain-containing protein
MMKRGLSLLEVMIALALLVGSAAVLSQLMDLGQRQALRAADITEAQTLCQNLLNELLAGTISWESTESQPIDPFSPWDYTIQIEPIGDGQLSSVTVIVTQHQEERFDESDPKAPAPPQYRLSRWVYRPGASVDPSLEPFVNNEPRLGPIP